MLDAPGRRSDTEPTARDGTGDHGVVRCAACSAEVASLSARVEMSGAHEHRFVNPHGLMFHLACYASAPGGVATGSPSRDFSWFPTYAWRVGLCRRCRTHLGWAFGNGDGFWGLIVDRIVVDER